MMRSNIKKWIHGQVSEQAFPHILVLGICLGLMLLSLFLTPARPLAWYEGKTSAEQVKFGSYALPDSCIMKNATGLPCPGCGLTRSWVSLCHGRVQESLQHHRLGVLVFFYAFLQVLRHFIWLVLPTFRPMINRLGRLLDYGIIVVILLLVLNWALILF